MSYIRSVRARRKNKKKCEEASFTFQPAKISVAELALEKPKSKLHSVVA